MHIRLFFLRYLVLFSEIVFSFLTITLSEKETWGFLMVLHFLEKKIIDLILGPYWALEDRILLYLQWVFCLGGRQCYELWHILCKFLIEAKVLLWGHSGEGSGTHSSTLAWKIPWTEEPGWLQSMGSWRVGHDWVTSLSLFTFMHWRRKWQPTPVFLPGESQGRGSLMGCRLWGHTESDTTEAT